MYVCLCHAITEREIRDAADEGLSSVQELGHCLGVATGCGQCASTAGEILSDQLQARGTCCRQRDADPGAGAGALLLSPA
ncbi:MAG: (2Fe-2S)-binding protein [Gammaproteobacteria bacterium]